jgi:hypothetical protein
VDRTNGSQFVPNNFWPGDSVNVSEFTRCANTRCTSSGSNGTSANFTTGASYWAWYFNGTALNASHRYLLELTIYGGVEVQLAGTGLVGIIGGGGAALVNSGNHGKREVLLSVTIS